MFVMKRFMAFIAVGLMLVAVRYYPIALTEIDGKKTYFDKADRITDNCDAYAYCRVDCSGGESEAQRIMQALHAEIVFTESVDDGKIYYCTSKALPRSVRVNGKRVNLTLSVRGDVIAVGSPLLKGAY